MNHLSRRPAPGAGVAACLTAPWVHAQPAWPTRPVAMTLPRPPGGGTDAITLTRA